MPTDVLDVAVQYLGVHKEDSFVVCVDLKTERSITKVTATEIQSIHGCFIEHARLQIQEKAIRRSNSGLVKILL